MDYLALQAMALTLLAKFGQNVTFTRDGTKVGTLKAVQLSSKRTDMKGSQFPNVSYTADDTREFIVAPGKTLAVGDVLSIKTTEFVVQEVDECNPAGTSMFWKVTCS